VFICYILSKITHQITNTCKLVIVSHPQPWIEHTTEERDSATHPRSGHCVVKRSNVRSERDCERAIGELTPMQRLAVQLGCL
jgi:hypothetical protein